MDSILDADEIVDLKPGMPGEWARFLVGAALERAKMVAPCIVETDFPFENAAKAILVPVVLRWYENGTGAASTKSVTAGPFGQSQTVDTRTFGGMTLTNAEKRDLADLCREWKGTPKGRRVFSFVPGKGVVR